MLDRLKRYLTWLVDPPWESESPETFTLAVPESHSTFKVGDVGWAKRPPAVVICPRCSREFDHQYANDFLDCPRCSFELSPESFHEVELEALICPECERELEHGIRHPEFMDVPEWASCRVCQYHWEYQHDFQT